jgi:acetamidase/formamidase
MKPRYVVAAALSLIVASAGLRAETHRFVAGTFYTTFSGGHPPALKIKSGDRVITATVDDVGHGADGTAMSQGLNPQTGPFYVEGAEPGDLLVVTIEKLTPNRATGYSTSVMAADSIDPDSISSRPDTSRFPWTIDTVAGVVRLDLHAVSASTDWKSRFGSSAFEMPLRPTLGSIGVAPASAETVAATESGPFGGNMVSAGMAAGARVMLPVLQPGALLYLGHGHARQGDGGVTGTGVETSLDVEFSVEVVKKQEWPHSSVVRPSTVVGEFPQGWPRVESADHLMTIGSAPTLMEALKHATIELHHWLDDDFGLSEKATSILMGQALEYEIASIAGPNFRVVARVRKAYLPPPVAAP